MTAIKTAVMTIPESS